MVNRYLSQILWCRITGFSGGFSFLEFYSSASCCEHYMHVISFMLLLIVSIKLITFGWKLKLVYNSTLLWTENKLPELLTIDASHQISNLWRHCNADPLNKPFSQKINVSCVEIRMFRVKWLNTIADYDLDHCVARSSASTVLWQCSSQCIQSLKMVWRSVYWKPDTDQASLPHESFQILFVFVLFINGWFI